VHFSTIGKGSLDTAVQSSQHPDVRVHHEVPAFRGADQTSDCGLPFLKILLGLRQLHDEVGSIAQSKQLAPIQQDRIIEGASPGGSGLQLCDQLSAIRDVRNAQLAFFSAASTAALSGQIVPLSRAAHGAHSIRKFEEGDWLNYR
jgi:hypothetical protein